MADLPPEDTGAGLSEQATKRKTKARETNTSISAGGSLLIMAGIMTPSLAPFSPVNGYMKSILTLSLPMKGVVSQELLRTHHNEPEIIASDPFRQ